MKLIKSAPESPTGLQGSTTIIEKDPGPSFAINQGPFMNSLISRKREHLSERQRVGRTLEISEFMGPIAKLGPGSISTIQQPRPSTQFDLNPRSLITALCQNHSNWHQNEQKVSNPPNSLLQLIANPLHQHQRTSKNKRRHNRQCHSLRH